MTVGRFATKSLYSTIALFFLVGAWPSRALAQDDHSHMVGEERHQTPEQKKQVSALVRAVRQATEQFQNVENAAPDYVLQFGCVTGGDFGAMGMHFLNGSLLDSEIDVNHPEILLYEPLPNGKLRLTGVDYLVFKSAWESVPEHKGPPQLMGQLFHLFDSPNRFGLDPFYALHVWAWKENPAGTVTNWNPNVSCDAFSGQRP
jgi:hypothetical protein